MPAYNEAVETKHGWKITAERQKYWYSGGFLFFLKRQHFRFVRFLHTSKISHYYSIWMQLIEKRGQNELIILLYTIPFQNINFQYNLPQLFVRTKDYYKQMPHFIKNDLAALAGKQVVFFFYKKRTKKFFVQHSSSSNSTTLP